jgi:hypothetical protein
MKNKTQESGDFFSRYHRARMFQYILPGFFGAFIALGLVSMSHTGDMRGLMASVSQVATPNYDADIVMERTESTIRIVLGKDAQAVDTISFRLMTDPSENLVFTPTSGTIVTEGEGVVQFVRSFAHQDISRGTVIVEFPNIDRKFPVALTDTEFDSA